MSDTKALAPVAAFSLAPRTLDEALKFASLMAESDLVPKDFKGKPGNVLIAVQMGQEVGLSPMQAIQNVAVVNGRPCLWGDAMLAIVCASSVYEGHKEELKGEGETMFAICHAKRRGQDWAARSFSVGDAKRAGLWGKAGPWQQYPKRMLQLRARAFALRDIFPDVLRGLQMAEEVQDITAEVVSETPAVAALKAPQRKAAPPPAPTTPPANGGSLTVTGVEKKSGESNGKAWTVFVVHLSDGRKASTFSESVAQLAAQCKADGAAVEVTLEAGKKDGTWNLAELSRVPGADDAF